MDELRRDSLPSSDQEESEHVAPSSIYNLPNFLSGVRFVGSFVLAGLALAGGGPFLLPLAFVLIMTDWVDGKIAIAWKQRTVIGARLDSLADVTFYASVLFALWWLKSDLIWAEGLWLFPGIIAYGVSCLLGLMKFGHIPTYHTRGAKAGWLLGSLTILAVFGGDWGWPIRLLGLWVLLVNIEAILITLVLPAPQVDLPTLYHAILARRRWLAEKNEASARPDSAER